MGCFSLIWGESQDEIGFQSNSSITLELQKQKLNVSIADFFVIFLGGGQDECKNLQRLRGGYD